jgi:WD40 repeat protein
MMTVGFTLRPRFSVAQLLVAIALSAFGLQIVLNGMYAPKAGSVYCVCCSPNGKIVATGSEDHSIRLWDTVTQRSTIFTGHRNLVRSLAFSSDGTKLASGSLDTTVRIWDVATGKELATLPGHTCANAVSFSPDGKILAVGDWARCAVHIWDLESKTLLATLVGHTDSVSSVSFSPDAGLGQRRWDGQALGRSSNETTDKPDRG